SLAFLAVSFAASAGVLLKCGAAGGARALLISLILALLAAILEAIAWGGADNLFIPLGSLIVLKSFMNMPVAALLTRLGLAVILMSVALAMRRRSNADTSAGIGAALAIFICGSVGGVAWIAGPLILFIGYVAILPRRQNSNVAEQHVYAVLGIMAPAL